MTEKISSRVWWVVISLIAFLFLWALMVDPLRGQSAQKEEVLNNDSVVKLVKLGLPEDTVIAKIETTAKTNFNLTVEEIQRMNKEGVSSKVLATMIRKSNPLKNTVVSDSGTQGQITIPDGTEIKLRVVKPISSATAQVEDKVEFEAAEEIAVDGVVVIPKGSPGWGKVIEAQKKKSFGRRGKLNFTIDYVKAVDGQNIRLRETREAKGNESYAKAGVVSALFLPAGLFIKGKDMEITAGTEYVIYIDGAIPITLNSVHTAN